MKKFFLFFLVSTSFSLILLSLIDYRKEYSTNKSTFNNLENLIEDAIKPSCSHNFYKNNNIKEDDIKEISITIPKSRNWEQNLLNAFIDKSNSISNKYKKRFKANIYLKNSKNDICTLKGRLRISGDGRDHLQRKKGYIVPSLDINLLNGNIDGIVNFKLFLPSTRNGSSEVFVSLFLKEMGYLSPRTKIIKVNLNNQNYEMIFQEKASKEMLENNNLRESAIIESDESLMWEIRSKNGTSSNGNIFPRVVNRKWIKRNLINQKIGLEGTKIFSKAILESWNKGGNDKEITFSDYLLSSGNIKNKKILSRYKSHLIASGSEHALYNHNRIFYYDPITKSLIPIYYDGNSKIMDLDKEFNFSQNLKDRFITRDLTAEDIDTAIKEVKEINLSKFSLLLNSSGVKIAESDLIQIKNKLIENLTFLRSNSDIEIQTEFVNNPLIRELNKNIRYGLIFYSRLEKNFYLCNLEEQKCKKTKLNTVELNKLLAGQYINDDIKYYFLGDLFDPVNKNYINEITEELNLIKIGNSIFIKKFGNPKITINKKKKLISIIIKNSDEKILFINSKLYGWDIKVFADELNNAKPSESRIDNNLLTSLVTIKDSKIKNLNIYINGGQHEDSFNIINSSGSIDKINIKNSFQDAIDFDFSNLEVNEISVQNAGNDCIDSSAGKYLIGKINIDGCKDKGVSVGEESYLKVLDAEIKNTNLALASKDFSKLIVNNAYLENNSLCAAAYNKKQEFGPSYISIPTKLCPKDKLAIQNNSILEQK